MRTVKIYHIFLSGAAAAMLSCTPGESTSRFMDAEGESVDPSDASNPWESDAGGRDITASDNATDERDGPSMDVASSARDVIASEEPEASRGMKDASSEGEDAP